MVYIILLSRYGVVICHRNAFFLAKVLAHSQQNNILFGGYATPEEFGAASNNVGCCSSSLSTSISSPLSVAVARRFDGVAFILGGGGGGV